MSMKRFMKWYYIVPAAIVLAPVAIALFVLLGGGIVMLLWNWLLPPLFDFPQITLLQDSVCWCCAGSCSVASAEAAAISTTSASASRPKSGSESIGACASAFTEQALTPTEAEPAP
jgi:hypothetical protein